MNLSILSIILDVLVLVFLGITTYYAIKLSESLNAFRKNKQEFEAIMRVLNRNIEDAYQSIGKLKDTARESGQSLSKIVSDSRKIAIELETINQESAAIADRLELSREARPMTAVRDDVLDEEIFRQLGEELEADLQDDEEEFSIMDRDMPRAQEKPMTFTSQAERDLYEALQRTRKTSGRGAV